MLDEADDKKILLAYISSTP